MSKVDSLSDGEIREKLIKLGCNVGPVTPTTRNLYVKKLNKLLSNGSPLLDTSVSSITSGESVNRSKPKPKNSPRPKNSRHTPLASSTLIEQTSPSEASAYSVNSYSDSTPRSVSPLDTYVIGDNLTPDLTSRHSSTSGSSVTIRSSQLSPNFMKDFDPSQPYSSDFTRHLSNLSANRIADITSQVSSSRTYSSSTRLGDGVKESDDDDESTSSAFSANSWKGVTHCRQKSYSASGESFFGPNGSLLILAFVGLLFILIGFTYFNIHHPGDTSVSSHHADLSYPRCDSSREAPCVPENAIKTVAEMFRILHRKIHEKAGCTPEEIPFLSNDDVVNLINENKKEMSIYDIEGHIPSLKLVVEANRKWNVVSRPQGFTLLTNPSSYYCSLVMWFRFAAHWIFSAILVLGFVAVLCAGVKWWFWRQARHQQEVRNMVERIIEEVSTCSTSESRMDFIVVSHIRDSLILPEQRDKKRAVWEEVEGIVSKDSRIRCDVEQLEGEDHLVWRWIAQPNSPNTSPTYPKKKVWQGQAFETIEGSVNALFESPPTPCLKLRHMFDPSQEEGEVWVSTVKDAILEKCRGAKILHIAVDKTSPEGCVYVKCASQRDAGIAYRALHGSWFDSKLVTAKYVREHRYLERFPDSAKATGVPLKPSLEK